MISATGWVFEKVRREVGWKLTELETVSASEFELFDFSLEILETELRGVVSLFMSEAEASVVFSANPDVDSVVELVALSAALAEVELCVETVLLFWLLTLDTTIEL